MSARFLAKTRNVDKVNVISFQNRAPAPEKIARFIRIKAIVRSGINSEKDSAAGLQMAREIIEKKVPFFSTPDTVALPTGVEAGRERGNQIEFMPEIGQWLKGFDFPDLSFDTQKRNQVIKKQALTHVEAKTMMTELLANKEEEPATAAKIDDFLRGLPVQL